MSAVQEVVANGSAAGGIDAPVLLKAMHALKKGDFSVRLPLDWTGVAGKVADAFNEVVELNERMARELDRLSRVVGKEGKHHPARLARRRERLVGRRPSTRSTT